MFSKYPFLYSLVFMCLLVWSTGRNIRTETGSLRIIGGNETDVDGAPFMVNIWSVNSTGGKLGCGGTILSANYVLTAAHCMNDTVSHTLLFGIHDYLDKTQPHRLERTDVTYVVHEDYKNPGYDITTDDIAIIKLNDPLPLSEFIKPVKLPSRKESPQFYGNQVLTAYGWGALHASDDYGSALLFDVKLSVIRHEACNAWVVGNYGHTLQDNIICLRTSHGKDTCHGDSGGPLMLDNETQVALISSGHGCAQGYPSYNVNLSYYLDWIEQHSDVKVDDN